MDTGIYFTAIGLEKLKFFPEKPCSAVAYKLLRPYYRKKLILEKIWDINRK